MEITSFNISQDRKNLLLTVTNAASADTLLLFTHKTYRDYNEAIVLSSKLNGSATQNITISLSEIGIPFFDGLYFIQVEGDSSICTSMVSDTTRYRECVLEKVISIDDCDECIEEMAENVQAVEAMLTALAIAVEDGYAEQSFNIIKALDKLCSNDCSQCGGYSNVASVNYFTTNTNS